MVEGNCTRQRVALFVADVDRMRCVVDFSDRPWASARWGKLSFCSEGFVHILDVHFQPRHKARIMPAPIVPAEAYFMSVLGCFSQVAIVAVEV